MNDAPKKNGKAGAISVAKSAAEKRAYVTDELLRAGFPRWQFEHWTDEDYARCFWCMTSGPIAALGETLAGGGR